MRTTYMITLPNVEYVVSTTFFALLLVFCHLPTPSLGQYFVPETIAPTYCLEDVVFRTCTPAASGVAFWHRDGVPVFNAITASSGGNGGGGGGGGGGAAPSTYALRLVSQTLSGQNVSSVNPLPEPYDMTYTEFNVIYTNRVFFFNGSNTNLDVELSPITLVRLQQSQPRPSGVEYDSNGLSDVQFGFTVSNTTGLLSHPICTEDLPCTFGLTSPSSAPSLNSAAAQIPLSFGEVSFVFPGNNGTVSAITGLLHMTDAYSAINFNVANLLSNLFGDSANHQPSLVAGVPTPRLDFILSTSDGATAYSTREVAVSVAMDFDVNSTELLVTATLVSLPFNTSGGNLEVQSNDVNATILEVYAGDISGASMVAPASFLISTAGQVVSPRLTAYVRPHVVTTTELLQPPIVTTGTITISIPSLTPGLADSSGGPFFVVQCPQVLSAQPAHAGDKLLYSQYYPEVLISRTTYVDVSNTTATGTAVVHFFAIPLSHPTEESGVDGNLQLRCTLLSDASIIIVPIRVTSCAISCATQSGLAEVALILYSTDDGSAAVLEVVRSLAFLPPTTLAIASPAAATFEPSAIVPCNQLQLSACSLTSNMSLPSESCSIVVNSFFSSLPYNATTLPCFSAALAFWNMTSDDLLLAQLSSTQSLTLSSVMMTSPTVISFVQDSNLLSIERIPTSYPNKLFLQSEHEFMVCGVTFDLEGARAAAQMAVGGASTVGSIDLVLDFIVVGSDSHETFRNVSYALAPVVITVVLPPAKSSHPAVTIVNTAPSCCAVGGSCATCFDGNPSTSLVQLQLDNTTTTAVFLNNATYFGTASRQCPTTSQYGASSTVVTVNVSDCLSLAPLPRASQEELNAVDSRTTLEVYAVTVLENQPVIITSPTFSAPTDFEGAVALVLYPEIFSVSGCAVDVYPGTSTCSPAGGDVLTITGRDFAGLFPWQYYLQLANQTVQVTDVPLGESLLANDMLTISLDFMEVIGNVTAFATTDCAVLTASFEKNITIPSSTDDSGYTTVVTDAITCLMGTGFGSLGTMTIASAAPNPVKSASVTSASGLVSFGSAVYCGLGANHLMCSGHGDCNFATGVCTCYQQSSNSTNTTGGGYWTGTLCDTCDEYYNQSAGCERKCPVGENSLPCSGLGQCAAGSCTCDAGYGGPSCGIRCPVVNGSICSHQGVCSGSNGTCICFNSSATGYFTGTACETCQPSWTGAKCNKQCAIDTTTNLRCGGLGTCYEGECFCGAEGRCGPTCQYSLWSSNASTLCHLCTSDSLFGSNCTRECPGTLASGMPCSGHGECSSGVGGSGICLCDVGYGLADRSGLCPRDNQGNICGGTTNGGSCDIATVTCQCNGTNTGVACDIPCPIYNGQVCGGRGSCVSDGYSSGCTCFPYFGGAACNETCTGHTTQCSGHGKCEKSGFCLCSESNQTGFWAGDGNCSTCSQEYNGANCIQQCARGANGLQCSGHGTCVGTMCFCFSGSNQADQGAWSGAVCDQCFPGYFGANCTSECPGGWCSPCGFQGTCSDGVNGTGLCTCNTSDTLGSFGGAACNACASGFYGASCTSMCPRSPSLTNASVLVVCGGRGTCSDGFNGTGVCTCDTGFARINTTSPCNQCAAGYYGTVCNRCPTTTSAPCSGRGVCSDGVSGTGVCACNLGFGGTNCSFMCPVVNNLTCGRGSCTANNTCTCATNFARVSNGTCAACVTGFWGANCTQVCPACVFGNCSSSTGTCTCTSGYWGALCQTQCSGGAANPCSGHGSCSLSTGACTCYNSSTQGYYTGTTCDVCQTSYASTTCRLACPINTQGVICNNRGTCFNGRCTGCHALASEYSSTVAICGVGCELRDAACFTFLNNCTQGFWGQGCPFTCPGTTPNASVVCNSNGVCNADTGICICKGGFYGDDCASSCARSVINGTNSSGAADSNSSLLPCSGQGSCAGNTCECFTGYYGEACEYQCPGGADNPCNGRGECSVFGICTCDGTAYGTACDQPCPGGYELPCNFQGTCMSSGGCSCFNDAIHGYFSGSACENCYGTYSGANCNVTCSAATGVVVGRACVCAAGFLGSDCSVSCPAAGIDGVCNGHGSCSLSANGTSAECACQPNYYGATCDVFCSVAYCMSDAVGLYRAQCNPNNGTCECQQTSLGNFAGANCSVCAPEWSGIECNIPCECSGNGQCDRYLGSCICNFAENTGFWTGANCSTCALGYMGSACTIKNVEISAAGTAGEAIVNSGYPATGVSLQDNVFGVMYVGANPIVLVNITGPNSSAVSAGVLHLLPAATTVAVSASIANTTHILIWCVVDSVDYVRIFVPRDPVAFLALGSVHLVNTSSSRRRFDTLGTLTASPALSATSALIGCTVTATSGQSIANVLCNDGSTRQIILVNTKEIASISFAMNGSIFIIAGTRVSSTSSSSSSSSGGTVSTPTSGWFRDAYDATSVNWDVLFMSDYQTSPFDACKEDPVTLNALCPSALGCVTFPDFTVDEMVCAWTQVLVDATTNAVTSRSILFARVYIANGSFVETSANSSAPNTPRVIAGGLEVTAMTGDLLFGIVIAAVLDSTNTTILYKIDRLTLALTGTYQVPRTLGDSSLVSCLSVDSTLRILYMSMSTSLSIEMVSLNLFGVKNVVPTTADLRGGRVVTVHGEGFLSTETYLCFFGSVPSETNATFVDNSTLLCVAPPASEGNESSDVCIGLNVNVQAGGIRTTNVSYVPIYRPLSAVLNYAYTAAGQGIGDSHVPTAITVSGFGFISSDAPSCKFLDSSGPNGSLRLIFETTNVSYLSTSEVVCNQPNLTSAGPSVPPAVIYYSHDSTVYSTTAATYAAVGVFDHLRAQDAAGNSLSATDTTEIQVVAQVRALLPAVVMLAADTFGNLMGSLDTASRPMKCSAANPISGASEVSYWSNDTILTMTMTAGVANFNQMIFSSPPSGLLNLYCFDTRDLINFVTFPVRVLVGEAATLLMTIPTTWVVGVLSSSTLAPNPKVTVADIAGNLITTSAGLPAQARLSYRSRQPDGMNDGGIVITDNTIVAAVTDDGTYEFAGVSVRTVFDTALQLTVFASQTIKTLVTSPLPQQKCVSGTEYAATGSFNCEPCPQYGICDGTSNVITEPGHWRANYQAFTFYACEPAEACPQSTQCGNGYQGPLCGSCADGYGLSGSECMPCEKASLNAAFIFLLFIALSLLIYFLSIFSMPFSTYEDNLIGIGGSEEQQNALLPIFVKLIISHFQIASVVPVKDLSLPAWIASFFTTSKDFSSFNPNLSFLSCAVAHDAENRMITTIVSVPLLIGCLAIVAIGVAWWQNRTFVARQLRGSKNARKRQLEALKNPTTSHVRDMKYIKATFDAEDRVAVLKHHTELLDWTDDAEEVWKKNNPAASGFFAPPERPEGIVVDNHDIANLQDSALPALGDSSLQASRTPSAQLETSIRQVVGSTIPAPPLWHRWLNMVLLVANVTLFFMYPSIVENCVNAMKCTTLDAGPNLPPLSVLTADPAIDCNSDAYEHRTLRLAILFIVLFGAGTPLLSAFLIVAVQHITCRGDVSIAKRMFSFMTKGYRLWFWEGISLARKAMIVVVVTLVPSSEVRTLSAVWIMTVFLAVSALVSPWANNSLAVFENVSFATLIVSYSLLTLFYLDYVTSSDGAKITILFFVVLVNVLCILFFIKGLFDAARGFLFLLGKSNPRLMQLYSMLFDKSIDSRAIHNRKIREDLRFRREWLLHRNPHAVFTARTELLLEIDAERLSEEDGSSKQHHIKAPISGARFAIANPEATDEPWSDIFGKENEKAASWEYNGELDLVLEAEASRWLRPQSLSRVFEALMSEDDSQWIAVVMEEIRQSKRFRDEKEDDNDSDDDLRSEQDDEDGSPANPLDPSLAADSRNPLFAPPQTPGGRPNTKSNSMRQSSRGAMLGEQSMRQRRGQAAVSFIQPKRERNPSNNNGDSTAEKKSHDGDDSGLHAVEVAFGGAIAHETSAVDVFFHGSDDEHQPPASASLALETPKTTTTTTTAPTVTTALPIGMVSAATADSDILEIIAEDPVRTMLPVNDVEHINPQQQQLEPLADSGGSGRKVSMTRKDSMVNSFMKESEGAMHGSNSSLSHSGSLAATTSAAHDTTEWGRKRRQKLRVLLTKLANFRALSLLVPVQVRAMNDLLNESAHPLTMMKRAIRKYTPLKIRVTPVPPVIVEKMSNAFETLATAERELFEAWVDVLQPDPDAVALQLSKSQSMRRNSKKKNAQSKAKAAALAIRSAVALEGAKPHGGDSVR